MTRKISILAFLLIFSATVAIAGDPWDGTEIRDVPGDSGDGVGSLASDQIPGCDEWERWPDCVPYMQHCIRSIIFDSWFNDLSDLGF